MESIRPSRRQLFSGAAAAALAATPLRSLASPQQPAALPVAVRSTKVGDLDVIAVQDASMAIPLAQAPFPPNVDRAELKALLDANLVPSDRVALDINAMIIRGNGDGVTLIDAGNGQGGRLADALAALGIAATDVKRVALTHVHGDHYGGLLTADKKSAFPNAEIFIHERELAFWQGNPDLSKSQIDAGSKQAFAAAAKQFLNTVSSQLTPVKGGAAIGPNLTFVEAFGHTPGHCMVRISSGSQQAMHFADLTHHYIALIQRPDWNFVFDTDPTAAIATKKRWLDAFASDKMRLFGTHMTFPGFGRVRKTASGYEWAIEPWVA